jgi:hypothetical protein
MSNIKKDIVTSVPRILFKELTKGNFYLKNTSKFFEKIIRIHVLMQN